MAKAEALKGRNTLSYSEGLFFFCYSVFWIPAATLLVAACKTKGQASLWGINNSLAATLIPAIQWTIKYMYVLYIILFNEVLGSLFAPDFASLYKALYGAVVYHYGTLITFYFIHNLSYTLAEQGEKKDESKTSEEEAVQGP